MSFDGSITAYIGADTRDYTKAMADIASSTQQAFDKAAKVAMASSSQMVQKIGQLMSQLSASQASLGSKIGQGLTGGYKIALGELHRIAANIGARLPEPVQKGLTKLGGQVNQFVSQVQGQLTGFASSTNAKLLSAFGVDFSHVLSAPKHALAELTNFAGDTAIKISARFEQLGGTFARLSQTLPPPFKGAMTAIASSLDTVATKALMAGDRVTNVLGAQVTNPIMQSWGSMVKGVGSHLDNFANKVRNSFGGKVLSQVSSLATKVSSGLGSAFGTLGSKATSVLNGISQKFASTSSAGQKMAGTVRSIVQAFSLMSLASKAINAVKGALDGAITRVDTMNRFPKTMELLGYSADQSKGAIDRLSKGIEGLPTTLDSAVSAAQQLTITTGDLGKGTELALAFNNAMLGYGATTENAQLALRQFNQALGAGKLQAEEFNSIAEAAPGLMNKMATAFGYSNVPEFKAALSDGAVTMQEFSDKLVELNGEVGGFADMAKTSAGGIRTAWGNVRNAVVRGVAGMITAFDEAAKANGMKTIAESLLALKPIVLGVFETINSLIPNAVAAFVRLKESVNIDFGPLGSAVSSTFGLINTALGEFAQKGELSGATIDKIKAKISEIGPKAVAAWALLNPGTAIATLMPLIGFIGGIGAKLGGLGVGLAGFGTAMGGAFATAGGFVGAFAGKIGGLVGVFGSAASKGLSVLSTMINGITAVAGAALASIGPAAILGLVVAGLGLINSQFGGQIDQLLNVVTAKGPAIIQNLVAGITSRVPELIASGAELIAKFASSFATVFPVLVQAGIDLIASLVNGIGQNSSSLISSAITIAGSFVQSILTALPQLLSVGMSFLSNLVQGIVQNIPQLTSTAQSILTSFTSSVSANMPSIITTGISILQNLITGLVQMLPSLVQMAGQLIIGFVNGLISHLPQLLQGGIQMIVSLVQGLIQNLPTIIQTAVQILQSLISGLMQALPQLIMAGIQLVVELAGALIMGLPSILQAGWELITGFFGAIGEGIVKFGQGIVDGITGLWDRITGKSKEGANNTKTSFDDLFTHSTAKTSQMSSQTGVDFDAMSAKMTSAMTTAKSGVTGEASAMTDGVIAKTGEMANQGTAEVAKLANGYTREMAAAKQRALAEADAMEKGVVQKAQAKTSGVNNSLNQLNSSVSSNWSKVGSTAQTGADKVANSTKLGFDKAKQAATQSVAGIDQTTASGLSKINSTVSSGTQKLQQTFTQMWDKVKSQTQSSLQAMTNQYQTGMSKLVQLSQQTGQQMVSVFNALQGQMAQAGSYAGAGFANGLAGQSGRIMAVANSIASNVAATIKRALDIHSPSRVTAALGGFTGEGFYNGMASWLSAINEVSRDYAQAVTDQKYGVDSHITAAGHVTARGVSSSLDQLSDDVRNSQLSEPVFEIHTELVGDKIYTSVKEQEARDIIRDSFFVYE